jgi:hypothetical protein
MIHKLTLPLIVTQALSSWKAESITTKLDDQQLSRLLNKISEQSVYVYLETTNKTNTVADDCSIVTNNNYFYAEVDQMGEITKFDRESKAVKVGTLRPLEHAAVRIWVAPYVVLTGRADLLSFTKFYSKLPVKVRWNAHGEDGSSSIKLREFTSGIAAMIVFILAVTGISIIVSYFMGK